jgi:hypothetical protein
VLIEKRSIFALSFGDFSPGSIGPVTIGFVVRQHIIVKTQDRVKMFTFWLGMKDQE